MKILNLYAGIGGNRKLWGGVEHEVTAIEIDESIAEVYKNYFPNDKVIVEDAHEYLQQHYKEFDLIWASPPCQTHSSFRHNIGTKYRGVKPIYPDMKLYQEIIFLKYYATPLNIKWVVENVKPYYEYLIPPNVVLQRHPIWSSFTIKEKKFKKENLRSAQIKQLEEFHKYDLSPYKLKNKRQVLRNCVDQEIGQYILSCAMEDYDK